MLPVDDLIHVEVDCTRFVSAVQAAFGARKEHRNPNAGKLEALLEQMADPASPSLPDPFLPTMRVLAHELYEDNHAEWHEATKTFRKQYCVGTDGQRRESTREMDAGLVRWRLLMSVAGAWSAGMREWFLSADKVSPEQCASSMVCAVHPKQRAAAMVYTFADVPLMHEEREDFVTDDGYLIREDTLLFLTGIRGNCVNDASAAEAIWKGLFNRCLINSKKALSPLARMFLGYLLTLIGPGGAAPAETYRVWAEDFADWARVDPEQVHRAFTQSRPAHSPAHELHHRSVVLPDWRWSDPGASTMLDLPWFSAPPRIGQQEGHPWQEVTITRELLPCLRRLCLYQDWSQGRSGSRDQ